MVVSLYDRYVRLSTTGKEWQNEIRGFLENYEFPCVGAWDGFHVYINSQLKELFQFQKRYSMTNLGLIGYNKSFLYAAVGAPGSTYDARLQNESSIYSDIINGNVIPDRVVQLGDFGEIPLVTIGDSAFPQFAWLIKAYNENTRDNLKKYFSKRLHGARVVTENAYDMLKARWGILFKKKKKTTECQLFNLRYFVMALHNLILILFEKDCVGENIRESLV